MQNSISSYDYLLDIRKHLLQTHSYFRTFAVEDNNHPITERMLYAIAEEIRSINRQIASIKEEECKLQFQTVISRSLNI